jgi:rhodanese-related sulfurtransferase
MSYVLRDASGAIVLFSGGSVLVGGAARTDLVSPDLTDTLTRDQFRTLRTAFAALPDATLLYPTHGGGSFCSTGSSARRTSTLGEERAHNPAMAFDDEAEFARWFPTTFPAIPAYFSRMRHVNQVGPRLRREIALPRPLDAHALAARRREVTIVDARPGPAYLDAHVPRSMSIPFTESFALWLGWLADPDSPLVLIADGVASIPPIVDEALLVGYERFAGYLDGGIEAWQAAGLSLQGGGMIGADEAREVARAGAVFIDVRERDEYAAGHLEGAINLPLGSLYARAGEIPVDRPVVAYCQAGDRSSSAVSLLERAGIHARSLAGGLDFWQSA